MKLIPPFKELYHNLLETERCKIFTMKEPASKNVKETRFQRSKYWDGMFEAAGKNA